MSYEGLKNYETWIVYTWLSKEDERDYWVRAALEAEDAAQVLDQVKEEVWSAEDAARYLLTERMQNEVTGKSYEVLPDAGIFTDLLRGALGNVEWQEIAGKFSSMAEPAIENDDS